MTIALSVALALVAGAYIMYETQYFWGKEDNPNINNMNNTMNTITNVTGYVGLPIIIIITILVVAIALITCFARCGF